jgi:hypothetical protein
MTPESIPAHSPFSSATFGQAYNEAAFKYFLDVDRGRVQRTERSILLVLVSVQEHPGRSVQLRDELGAQLFTGLAGSVRVVDFIGWPRHGRVIGAVLPQAISASRELRNLIADRVLMSLKKSLPRQTAAILRVRVVVLGGKDHQQ